MSQSAAERYLWLGLRLGRHVDAIVDAYFGPAEFAAAVAAEPPVEARNLVSDADVLLAELDDGWLRDQVTGLRTYAGVLAGESRPYVDEVEGCYGVRPRRTDEAVFAAAHEELEELLPGSGPLAERYKRWEDSMRIPSEQIEPTLAAVIEEARGWTRRLVELPDGESVALEIVHDEPWWASCDYLGGLRSRIRINVDLPMSALDLLVLAIHETYPGHHTERSLKDDSLVRGQGLLEETIVLAPTPQSLVTEGIGKLAPELLLGGEGGPAIAEVVQEAGVELDLAHALSVHRAVDPCQWAEVNAALMLHVEGVDEAAAQAYLERWELVSPELAAHVIRYITEPSQRTYVMTLAAGRDLCRSYVAGDSGGFRSLLTQQVRVRDLIAAQPAGRARDG